MTEVGMAALLELPDLPVLLGEFVVCARILVAIDERVLLALLEWVDDSPPLQMLPPVSDNSTWQETTEKS